MFLKSLFKVKIGFDLRLVQLTEYSLIFSMFLSEMILGFLVELLLDLFSFINSNSSDFLLLSLVDSSLITFSIIYTSSLNSDVST